MKKNIILLSCLAAALTFVSCKSESDISTGVIASSAADTVDKVNKSVWQDTSGEDIQTHDGIIYWQGKYYWYGLDYSQNLINGGSGGFKAVKCYESEDLVNWTFKNNVLTANSSVALNEADVNNVRVIYNKNTNKFVMWMGYNTTYMYGTSLSYWTLRSSHNKLYLNANLCATADTPYEAFEVANSYFTVNGGAAITSLFVDDDGSAYCLDWANYNNSWRLYINKLTDDYLGVSSNVAMLFPETYVGRSAIVKHNGYYYLIGATFYGDLDNGANSMSSADGWLDYHFTYYDFYRGTSVSTPKAYTGVMYCSAQSLDGPWSGLSTFGPDYEDYEFSDCFKIQGSEGISYMLTFNQWDSSDLSQSAYVWQPLFFNKVTQTFDEPYFDDYDTITIDAAKGTVSAE
ncbi:family 43 glycosylhydrolase [Treponema sp.]|uniref:family 43 glycosylhydrolase n=1 Tax=Treponema sp. TaxID=166 RepID=UPI0025E9AE7B|nr:family 43 glycosylhydrolase [Treponema sp.]MCR5219342.1 family 43 glycosylhydrolase [Treponema sp.]